MRAKVIKKKFIFALYLSLFYSTTSYGMLKEIIKQTVRETFPYPRHAACLCAAKATATCKAKNSCAKLFLSPVKTQDFNGPERVRHLGLFEKQPWLKAQKLGRIFFYYDAGYQGKIHNLYLNKDYRSKGLGHLLMRHALNEMDDHNVTAVTLAVHISNDEARGLYKKCGFFEYEKIDGGSIMAREHPGSKNGIDS